MKVRCDYCGQFIRDTDPVCPNCGAPNALAQRSGAGVPKTIDELRQFCAARNLPLAKMRFFLGEDYRGARAFGIFQDEEGNFVVYKNKSDGSRAVRYRGKDEAYAVNELYQKLRSEVMNQREHNARQQSKGVPGTRPAKKRKKLLSARNLFLLFFLVLLLFYAISALRSPRKGYYRYNGGYYYNQLDDWYYYDGDLLEWVPAIVDEELSGNYRDYYESYSYSGDYDIDDFSDSGYYVESSSSRWRSDWDDDDDWDWGSDDWDSGWSDWDSDW